MQITVTPLRHAGVEVLPPDIIWNGTSGDFAVSTTSSDGGVGGLFARNTIETAILLLLFTDARVDASDLRFEMKGDRRGWVGDGFDVDTANGEAPLGSYLWLLRRSVLNDKVFADLVTEAKRALQPLIDQDAVVAIDVTGTMDKVAGRVELAIDVYGRKNRKVYAQKFGILWGASDGL